ncbi:MAG: carboxymuconolactone decarboxylase family protein [Nitrosomonadaceae bacterium]|nr:carboxymuconolactone decarboxylase family protein [Nitrosomonadaceae bacterium]
MSGYSTLSLPQQHVESGSPKVKEVLETALKQTGFIPNMYSYMANAPGLLNTYLFGYNQFRNETGFSPIEQEVVLLTISRENGCHYCVAAHSVVAAKFSKVPEEVTGAIRNSAAIPDAKLNALSEFTKTLLNTRGHPEKSDLETFLAAGYAEQNVLDILLAISVKIISNYANHLFDTPLDDMFKSREWHTGQVL